MACAIMRSLWRGVAKRREREREREKERKRERRWRVAWWVAKPAISYSRSGCRLDDNSSSCPVFHPPSRIAVWILHSNDKLVPRKKKNRYQDHFRNESKDRVANRQPCPRVGGSFRYASLFPRLNWKLIYYELSWNPCRSNFCRREIYLYCVMF